MNGTIRILLVEDVGADAELAVRELKRANMRVEFRRVDTFADYRRELDAFSPQVILCDFSMPKFDGLEALRIARQSFSDIPFIFVSGTIGEESAVIALKNGAKDYVLKGNLLRLPAAVERALKETEERRVRRAHEQDLRMSEKLHRALFQGHPHPTLAYDILTLRILAANDAALGWSGYKRAELLAMYVQDILSEKDLRRLIEHVAEPSPEITELGPVQYRKKSGELIDARMAFYDVVVDGKSARVLAASGRAA